MVVFHSTPEEVLQHEVCTALVEVVGDRLT